ncbi:MAG: hypothetical protein ACSLFO_01155 [Acidimicrobiales bacterium]
MGQNVTVVEKQSSNPKVVRFEINRSLTGMGHERYGSIDDVVDDRAVDVLARRLFDNGGVDSIHVNSSVITVQLGGGSTGTGLLEVIQNLFRFYGDEVPDEDVTPAGPPVDVAEPDAAAAPESTSDEETAKEATVADEADAPGDADTASATD